MKKASITDTTTRLRALIGEVREGETILVLDRGRPVARIESVVSNSPGPPGRLERLERKGLIRRAEAPRPEDVLATPPPRPAAGSSALAELLAERESGR